MLQLYTVLFSPCMIYYIMVFPANIMLNVCWCWTFLTFGFVSVEVSCSTQYYYIPVCICSCSFSCLLSLGLCQQTILSLFQGLLHPALLAHSRHLCRAHKAEAACSRHPRLPAWHPQMNNWCCRGKHCHMSLCLFKVLFLPWTATSNLTECLITSKGLKYCCVCLF